MFMIEALQSPRFCPMCETMRAWGWVGMLLMAAFWVAVIALVVWVVVRLMDRGDR